MLEEDNMNKNRDDTVLGKDKGIEYAGKIQATDLN